MLTSRVYIVKYLLRIFAFNRFYSEQQNEDDKYQSYHKTHRTWERDVWSGRVLSVSRTYCRTSRPATRTSWSSFYHSHVSAGVGNKPSGCRCPRLTWTPRTNKQSTFQNPFSIIREGGTILTIMGPEGCSPLARSTCWLRIWGSRNLWFFLSGLRRIWHLGIPINYTQSKLLNENLGF